LQQSLPIFGFGPVDQSTAVDVAGSFQFFFGALEVFFLENGLRDRHQQAASFEVSERDAEKPRPATETLQKARGQTGSEAGRERKPGEG